MNNFKDKILQKYPDANIITDKYNNIIASINQDNTIKILGCNLCFDNNDVRVMEDKVMIKNTEAIPVTAVAEDDSMNPAMSALFFCPICSRIITHPNFVASPIMERTMENWKD